MCLRKSDWLRRTAYQFLGLSRCSRNHSGGRRKDERFSCQRRTMEGQSTDRRPRGAVSHPRIFLRVLIIGSAGPGQAIDEGTRSAETEPFYTAEELRTRVR